VLPCEHTSSAEGGVVAAETTTPPRRGGEDVEPIRVLAGCRAAREFGRGSELDIAGVQLIQAQPPPPGCSNPVAARSGPVPNAAVENDHLSLIGVT
jgi:hypothetical protein